MNAKVNPIAEQSKKWLTDSLLQLMEEKPYDAISIKEITDRAQLARRTYYRNFKSKDDIISQYCNSLCSQYVSMIQQGKDYSLSSVAKSFYSLWYEHKNFLALLRKNNILHIVLNKFNEVLPKIYSNIVGDLSEYDSLEIQQYALLSSAGGFYNILSYSLAHDFDKKPEEIETLVYKVVETFKNLTR